MAAASLSQRQFAARVGCSPTLVKRLCERGELPANRDKSIPLDAGLAAWEARGGKRPSKAPGPPRPAPAAPEQDGPPEPAAPHAELAISTRRADLVKKSWDARLRELEFKRLSGELVPLAEVQADARATAEVIRARLLAIPPRAAPLCAAVPAGPQQIPEMEAVIADEINLALEALQKARFGGAG